MRRLLRRAAMAALGLVLAAAALGGGGLGLFVWLTLPAGVPPSPDLPGLSAPVSILLDKHGIPSIRAATADDAAEALGYLHARDRLFQMELMVHAASGRLAEWFGPKALDFDREMRTLDLRDAAYASAALLSPPARALLDAYARGVNAYIAAHGRLAAPEFVLLGRPEPWRVEDSLLWGEWLAYTLSGNATLKLEREALRGHLPDWKILQLHPGGAADKPPRQAGSGFRPDLGPNYDPNPGPGLPAEAARLLAHWPRFPAPFTEPSTASNEFAVAASRSASGAPLLAGDPHLAFEFPGLWYLVRIDTPGESLAGASGPGAPFVVFGHNRDVAWTFTNNGADVQDIFIEHGAGDGHYETPDGPKPFAVRHETIKVKGRAPVSMDVLVSRHGPVVGRTRTGDYLALEAANLAPDDRAADALMVLNGARGMADVSRAAALLTTPVENLLAASRTDIGLFVTGRVPVRKSGDARFPADGASGAADWTGFASGAALPHIVDPPGGILVNTNEPVSPPDFPVYMGGDTFGDWRSQRIRARLAKLPQVSAADMALIQMDDTSAFAKAVLPAMLAAKPADARGAEALALLRAWNFTMGRHEPQPLIFNAWVRRFRADVLTANAVPAGAAPPTLDFTAFVLGAGKGAWCGGDCAPLLSRALAEALAALPGNPDALRWGAAHPAVFAHPVFSHLPLVGRFFRFSIPDQGDDSTVDRAVPRAPGWEADQGPSYRGVYDLADLDASRFIIAPGQSGNPFSRQAADLLRAWRDGNTLPLPANPH